LPVSELPTLIRFGTFELDVRSGELRRNGSRIRLQDQPLQILLTLLDRPGEVVTREELHSKLWPADTFVDFDHGLNAAIKRLRDALGDTADNPRYIETLARRGYRFVAPVSPNNDGTITSGTAPHVQKTAPRSWPVRLFVAAGLLLLLGSLVGWIIARRTRPVWPGEQRLTSNPADLPIIRAVISPDGKYLAYADRTGLFVREVASGEAHAIALPDKFSAVPTGWFPDGTHLLVTKWRKPGDKPSVWSISLLGGAPHMLVDHAWVGVLSPDGAQLAFSRGDNYAQTIWIEPIAGGDPRKVVDEPGELFGAMAFSPDAKHLAFIRSVYRMGYHEGDTSIAVADFSTGQVNYLVSNPGLEDAIAWSSDGRLIYSQLEPRPNNRESNLWAIGLNPHTAKPMASAIRLTMGPDRKTSPSLSGDGKVLTFLRRTSQAEIYVGNLADDMRSLSSSSRLILEEGTNLPFDWAADSQSVIFVSDRNGWSHLFRQDPARGSPDQVVRGNDRILAARMNPSGSAIIYSVVSSDRMDVMPMSIMSIPIAGGSPRLLFKGMDIANLQCARSPSTVCLIGRTSATSLIFSMFDSETGTQTDLTRLDGPSVLKINWSLSPDGSQLVMGKRMHQVNPAELTIFSIRDKSQRTIRIEGWTDIRSLDWGADGRTIWVGASSPAGTEALLSVDMKGNATPVVLDDEHELGWAIPSRDGRRIAYWKASGTSNAWMLQGF